MGSILDEPTWGIPGPTFLLAYALIALAVLVLALGVRRSVRAGRPVASDSLQARPEDVAFLNGGPELAVWSALSAMYVDGIIATSGPGSAGVVHSVGTTAGTGTGSDLRRAIHAAARRPIPRRSLMRADGVEQALDEIRGRLETAGLLLTAEQQWAYRRPGIWMLAVLALGGARMFAGLANGRPVDYLLVETVLVGVAAAVLLARVRTRTVTGDAALAAQRSRHGALSPSMRPDWGAVGAGAAALSVGVFGVGALMAAEPAFAEDLEAQKSAAIGGGGSGWSGGSDGGGDGGGGDGGGGGGGGCGGGGCGG